MIDSHSVNYRHKYWNLWARFAASSLLLPAFALAAFSASATLLSAQSAQAVLPDAEAVASEPAEGLYSVDANLETYRIGIGDILRIDVWKEPDHSDPGVVVRPDGKISLPLLREIEVLGLTPVQAEDLLTEKFKEFINNPTVTIVVREVRSQIVFVTGGVMRPGSMMMRPGMTVWHALSEAGGVAEYAKKKKIYVVREIGGKRTTIDYDYNAVMSGEVEKDLALKTGDTIVVPE